MKSLRILFVDDEMPVLDALRRMLHTMRQQWEMAFVISGEAALEVLEREPFDVIVCDMRMPGIDGATLLAKVRELYPDMVRIVLSGYTERETVLRVVGRTHQFLSKPCEPEMLKRTIARAFAMRCLLKSDVLRGLAANMDELPSLPSLYQELVAELQKPNASMSKLADVIRKDVAMSAKVLHLVNSAYFGLRSPVSSVERAINYLGLDMLQALVLSHHLFTSQRSSLPPEFSLEGLWEHSFRASVLAKAIGKMEQLSQPEVDDAVTASMLHDVGKLLLAANFPERYQEVLRRHRRSDEPLWALERRTFGATHGELGAYLMGLWGLADSTVEAVAYHANPSESPIPESNVLVVVHAASALASNPEASTPEDPSTHADQSYLENIGKAHRWPAWQAAARDGLSQEATP